MLASDWRIVRDTWYVALTSDTIGENNWFYLIKEKLLHTSQIDFQTWASCGGRSCNLLKRRINLIFIHFVLLSFKSETEFRSFIQLSVFPTENSFTMPPREFNWKIQFILIAKTTIGGICGMSEQKLAPAPILHWI